MEPSLNLRLGVNIDHVATIRNARGSFYPDPLRAALVAQESGADGITAHLREDRRHIRDDDIKRLVDNIKIPLNFEMAATEEMKKIALESNPHAVCLVPEKREEKTTEGGLDVLGNEKNLEKFIMPLRELGSRVSIFVEAEEKQIKAAHRIGADVIELHTGTYCEMIAAKNFSHGKNELENLKEMSALAHSLGLEVHAGHGLSFETVSSVANIPELRELNIGHFIVSEAIFLGLKPVISQMRALISKARVKK